MGGSAAAMADVVFKKCVLNRKRLAAFGFKPDGGGSRWDTALLGGAFKMSAALSPKGQLSTKVIDAATGEEYVLHLVSGAAGSFVGKVRDAYDQALAQIRSGCFDEAPFSGKLANRLRVPLGPLGKVSRRIGRMARGPMGARR